MHQTFSSSEWSSLLRPGAERLMAHPPYPVKGSETELMQHLQVSRLVLLDNNEEALGPSPRVAQAISRFVQTSHRYPDGHDGRLLTLVAGKHQVEVDQVLLGTGSNYLLELIARAFLRPGQECVVSEYAYQMFLKTAVENDAQPVVVPSREWGHDLQAMAARVGANTGLVFIANPNNPTGTLRPLDEIERLLEQIPRRVVVVVDEAYFEYADGVDPVGASRFIARHPNLIVTRTFSKAYALAALRIGYCVTSAQMVQLLRRVTHPYRVSSLAIAAAEAALDDTEHLRRVVEERRQTRSQLLRSLTELGLPTIPSQTNFVTFEVPVEAEVIVRDLRARGILVRGLASYRLPRHIRATLGHSAELTLLADALDELLRATR